MARAPAAAARHSDERLIRLYLDMLAAERGAGPNTLAAYERDLQDLATHLKRARRSIVAARTADLRAYLEELSRRGLQAATAARRLRSEEHTSELQSHLNLVCRLLLEKKKYIVVRLVSIEMLSRTR